MSTNYVRVTDLKLFCIVYLRRIRLIRFHSHKTVVNIIIKFSNGSDIRKMYTRRCVFSLNDEHIFTIATYKFIFKRFSFAFRIEYTRFLIFLRLLFNVFLFRYVFWKQIRYEGNILNKSLSAKITNDFCFMLIVHRWKWRKSVFRSTSNQTRKKPKRKKSLLQQSS